MVAEGINPIVEYVYFPGMTYLAQQLKRFEHRHRPWPERTPRQDLDGKQWRQLTP
ncbi:hypothetical protein K469DRAFT_767221 [Zopfia rhizophila CBS 207.26]|uniref:Uncharacterized protein n=1 Tax=Zopfia rhizophila CBS 207.26 TaxID=1314779 RepID=A0A6A6D9X5_9PEZI|nr:hypothetical protein K469DRAFT_767221 [Zopfia rhizophila CBS 207.26]